MRVHTNYLILCTYTVSLHLVCVVLKAKACVFSILIDVVFKVHNASFFHFSKQNNSSYLTLITLAQMEKCISNKPECRRSNGGLNGGGEEIMGQVAKHTLKTHSISPPFLQECFHHRRYRNSLLFYPLETHHAKLHFLLFLLLSLWVTSSSCFYTINSHLQLTHLCQHLASYIHLIFFKHCLFLF